MQTFRALREVFGPQNRPKPLIISRIVNHFEEHHTLLDERKVTHRHPVRTPETIQAVRRHVRANPNVSLRRRSQQLNVSVTSLQRILTVDLKLHPYKIELTQHLKPTDHELRRRFVDWCLQNLDENPEFSQFLIFSDEAM